jgi:hypothetical protein
VQYVSLNLSVRKLAISSWVKDGVGEDGMEEGEDAEVSSWMENSWLVSRVWRHWSVVSRHCPKHMEMEINHTYMKVEEDEVDWPER